MAKKKSNPPKKKTRQEPPAPAKNPSYFNWKEYIPHGILFLLAFVLYANTIGHGYALDDSIVITENDFTKKGFGGIGDLLTNDAFTGFFGKDKNLVEGGRYRPLSMVTFAMEWEIAKRSPGLSHFMNILLYGLTCILLFMVFNSLLGRNGQKIDWLSVPFVAAMIFLVHPIHTEAVANIKGRDEIMSLMFCLGALWLSLKYYDQPKIHYLVASGIVYFLGLMSKENAIPFIVIIPLSVWFFRKMDVKKLGISSIPLTIAAAFFLYSRYEFTVKGSGGEGPPEELLNNPFLNVSASDKFATIFYTLGKYLKLLIIPHPLSHDYYPKQIPILSWSDPKAIIPLLGYVALGGYAIWGMLKKKAVAFGLIWFFATLSVVSNIVIVIGTFMSERFVFMPSAGLAMIFGLLIVGFGRWLEQKKAISPKISISAILALIVIPFSVLTILRNPVWKDNLSLFTTDVHTVPNSIKAQTAAGGELVERYKEDANPAIKKQKLEEAKAHLTKAIELYPTHSNAWLLLGNAFFYSGDAENARRCFYEIMKFNPQYNDAYVNLAFVNQETNNHGEMVKGLRAEANNFPKRAKPWYSMGISFEHLGLPDSAVYAFEQAVARKADYGEAWAKLGSGYGRFQGKFPEAQVALSKAIELGYRQDWVYENLGIAYAMTQEFDKSLDAFSQGFKVNPNSAKLCMNIAITYQQMGDLENYQIWSEKAFQIDPGLRQP